MSRALRAGQNCPITQNLCPSVFLFKLPPAYLDPGLERLQIYHYSYEKYPQQIGVESLFEGLM